MYVSLWIIFNLTISYMSFNISVPEELIQDVSDLNVIVSGGLQVDGNVNITSSVVTDSSNEQMMFDTIVIRRPSGYSGHSDYYLSLIHI